MHLATKFVFGFVLLFQFCAAGIFFTSVAEAQGQAGVSISPAIIEEGVTPGAEYSFDITIKNLNPVEQIFYISTRDISDVRDGATPVFADIHSEKTGMELAGWIELSTAEIKLAPGISERFVAKIKIPGDATPGSHFGSIVVSAAPPDIQDNGAAVGYDVANIISLRVAGDVDENANIRQFSTKRFLHGSLNVDFETRIENEGNVLVRPSGPIEVYNMLGKKVDTFTFNESQGAVFPGRVREYAFTWQGEGTGFGRYEVVLSAVYGDEGSKKTVSSTASFWVLPLNIIGPAFAVLAVILLLTFVFVRLYIKRTLAHLSHGQTRIVRRRKSKGLSATLLLTVVMLTVTALFMIIMLVLFA
jgi:hypothetical protein